ncbi:UNVERIFIED_CONTAM: hypothetical protein GTU68_055137 [Idotea baltica]|nr:hypothetical protein [Idotea baltica]
MSKKYNIAVVNGDGIGHEIVPASLEVLQEAAKLFGFELKTETFPWGAGHYLKHGVFMPEDGLDILSKFDAIYFGAVGLKEVDDTLPAMLYTFKVRTHFKQYVNYRPAKLLPGIQSPLRTKTEKDIDLVVVRENNEGEFVQNGKIINPDSPYGLATDTSLFTRHGIERIARYAFKLAQKRRKHLTNITKSNTLIHSLAYWDYVIEQVSTEFPDVAYQKMYVDNASANFVLHPEYFDVILTTNMIGDILSDLGGAIMGSLGLGSSGNINPEREHPSMFEPIHGSAPDIAGKGIANPIGQILSGAVMLDHLGETAAAKAIENAVAATTRQGIFTPDLGGNSTTQDVAESVKKALSS